MANTDAGEGEGAAEDQNGSLAVHGLSGILSAIVTPRRIALIGLVAMSALQTGGWAQVWRDFPLDLWRLMRAVLIGEKGDTYLRTVQGSLIPPRSYPDGMPHGTFEGKVVSQPSPKTLVVKDFETGAAR